MQNKTQPIKQALPVTIIHELIHQEINDICPNLLDNKINEDRISKNIYNGIEFIDSIDIQNGFSNTFEKIKKNRAKK